MTAGVIVPGQLKPDAGGSGMDIPRSAKIRWASSRCCRVGPGLRAFPTAIRPKKAAATVAPTATRGRVAGSRSARSTRAVSGRVALDRQVGQQRGQLVPGPGGEGLLGSLLEFLRRQPSDLEGAAQLGYREVTLGV